MINESHEILNSMLVDWYLWAKSYQHVGGINSSPMFRQCKNGRQWDTLDEIMDSDLENSRLEALDHIIMEMKDVYRTSIQIQARNLYTGKSVWTSIRLPKDMEERANILFMARMELIGKLRDAGIL